MTDQASPRIRSVKVELLRAGPAHNQLLSPLTPYLGICNGAQAGIVHAPFEHHALMRQLARLRDAGAEARDRGPVLRDMGVALAGMFGAIPHLPGSLDGAGSDGLVHLRLVMSAAELAVLPFELAKVSNGAAAVSEDWLSLQVRVPVVITRRTREVPAACAPWPSTARILFVSADPATVPCAEHRLALVDAVQPWLKQPAAQGVSSAGGRREDFEDVLTILHDASFEDVVRACSQQRYTHVHVLAHGATDPQVEEASYGLVLNRPSGEPEVISGERLASALCRQVDGASHSPTVATLAACDGGNLGSVLITGASMAHALHRAGIPLVVASQFPLSKEGSELVTRQLYPGLLAGEHPLPLLHRLRTELHALYSTRSHDWASLVVYESFADDIAAQLETVRYRQAMRAMNLAADRLLLAVRPGPASRVPGQQAALAEEVARRAARLPVEGPHRLECLGLQASAAKRLAEAEFETATAWPAGSAEHEACMQRCLKQLEEARLRYEQAATGFLLRPRGAVQDDSTLHWVLGQQLCMAAVLGRPARAGSWEAAHLSAETALEEADPGARGWGLGTLAELWLLRLADPALLRLRETDLARYDFERARTGAQAQARLAELRRLAPASSDDRNVSTRRQLLRYTRWWGDPDFEAQVCRLAADRSPWRDLGIVQLAEELLAMIPGGDDDTGPPAGGHPGDPTPPSPPPAPPPPPPAASGAKATTVAPSAPAPSPTGPPAAGTHFSIEMLPAGHGDCLWIEYGQGSEVHRVLVDCGTARTCATELKPRIASLPADQRRFELFILSHIDDDHIGGAIPLLHEASSLGLRFGDVWFNGWRHLEAYSVLNARQGEEFSKELLAGRQPWNAWKSGGAIVLDDLSPPQSMKLPGGMTLTLLSPSVDKLRALAPRWAKEIAALGKQPGDAFMADEASRTTTSTDVEALAAAPFEPDTAANNGSSIAVLAEYGGKSVLLGADAHAPLLQAAVARLLRARGGERLRVDAFKLPHHGSRNNVSVPLMQLLDCRRFLVSSSGARFRHPDRQAVARALLHGGRGSTLYFNYRSDFNAVWAQPDLQATYGYSTEYPPEGQAGLKVIL